MNRRPVDRSEHTAAKSGGLAGSALLVVFTDVGPEDETEFHNWYNREHIGQLLKLPGFRRARRYGSTGTPPRFLAVYEVEEIGVLAAPDYLDLLADQSPWSRRIIARFSMHERLCCRVTVDAAQGLGGAIGLMRHAGAGDGKDFRQHLAESVFPEIVARFGLHGAISAENDLEVTNAPRRLRGVAFTEAQEPESLIFLEGADVPIVDEALNVLRSRLQGTPLHVRSTRSYRMLYADEARN